MSLRRPPDVQPRLASHEMERGILLTARRYTSLMINPKVLHVDSEGKTRPRLCLMSDVTKTRGSPLRLTRN